MQAPKPDKPPYTPVTPQTDTLVSGAPKPLFGVSSSPVGVTASSGQKKSLIGGSA